MFEFRSKSTLGAIGTGTTCAESTGIGMDGVGYSVPSTHPRRQKQDCELREWGLDLDVPLPVDRARLVVGPGCLGPPALPGISLLPCPNGGIPARTRASTGQARPGGARVEGWVTEGSRCRTTPWPGCLPSPSEHRSNIVNKRRHVGLV